MIARTVTLPINPGAVEAFTWGQKDIADDLVYAVDASAWAADAGTSLADFDVLDMADPALTVSDLTVSAGIASFRIFGGTAGTTETFGVLLYMANQRRKLVRVSLGLINQSVGLAVVGTTHTATNGGAIVATIL